MSGSEAADGRHGDRDVLSEPGTPDRSAVPTGATAWDTRSHAWPPGAENHDDGGAEGPTWGEAVTMTAPPGGLLGGPRTGCEVSGAVHRHGTGGVPGAVRGTGGDVPAAGADALPGAASAAGPEPGTATRPGAGSEPRKGRRKPLRRGAGDPVKTLLHHHRDLCERAVDPLEIAAGLEAQGVTDRTAARFRHRDVFSLAEELYARVPRDGAPRPRPEPPRLPPVRIGWVLLTLLPGALATALVPGLRLTHGRIRTTVALGALLALALAVRAALRRGPLAAESGTPSWRTAPGTRLCTLWLLGYALLGDGLLRAAAAGGPLPTGLLEGHWPVATAPALALALACAPAAWCAHLLTAGARRKLARSRGLEDFTAAARPLLTAVLALFLGALTGLLALCGTVLHRSAAYPQGLTLGALLLLARLLVVHQHRHAPALALGAAAAAEALTLGLVLAARVPGCAALAAPVRTLVGTWGPAAVPTLACAAAALALLVHALRTLTRASAHAPAGAPE
ncbi:hypothetical protein ABZX39_01225 [Streptomyces collinus]|uniref:hypothetical protein n=1 Tax=Streptomyces collinus TaxID=42684 RepID=UPI0033A121A7